MPWQNARRQQEPAPPVANAIDAMKPNAAPRRTAAVRPLVTAVLTGAFVALALYSAAAPPKKIAAPADRTATATAPVDFDREIRPLLSDNCFACHGFDANKRQAGLRLDTAAGAYARLESGGRAVVPGRPDASELLKRIGTAHGDPLLMPPASTGKKLTTAQLALLRRWIAQGGRYAPHWSFVAPKRPAVPSVPDPAKWTRTPVDRFVLARLRAAGLSPSPEADRETLLRRVALDLTGLPPTPEARRAFLADRSPDAYEKAVDRLLSSPHYGEQMARGWLDLARYADTHGYHIDSHRDMWRWRDWVIDAYNTNLPYDRFVIEQLAGDLLPDATLSQRIATGFNRNHPINFEGGAIPEEYAAAYVFDRADTTATVFMGLTMACAKCHDHKYDPVTQKDYYRFFALFNNIAEQGLDGQKGNAAPLLKAPTPEQTAKLASLDARVAEAETQVTERAKTAPILPDGYEATLAARRAALDSGIAARFRFAEPDGPAASDAPGVAPLSAAPGGKIGRGDGPAAGVRALTLDGSGAHLDLGPDALAFDRGDAFSYGAWVKPADGGGALTVLSRMDEAAEYRGWDLYLSGGKAFAHLIHRWDKDALRVNTKTALPTDRWTHVFVTYDGSGKAAGVRIYLDGRPAELEVTHDALTGSIRAATPARIGRRSASAAFKGSIADVRVYGRRLTDDEVARLPAWTPVAPAAETPAEKRTAAQNDALLAYYRATDDDAYRKLAAARDAAKKERDAFDASIPTVMVMQERPGTPRETFMLARGEYDKPGEKVSPGTPASLPPLRLSPGARPDRLAMARWLLAPEHPLTARVAANRLWQTFFGAGLVRTPENWGMQGAWPTHPELLDWLATEYRRTGWDTKKMIRLLVTSSAYRQSSRVSPLHAARDPENKLWGRAPRPRLSAETLRDQALAASGLLVPTVGGPSVRPYQPPGLWEEMSFGSGFTAQRYEQDHGDALYRRSLYTFWKRTVPPPSLQTFDAPEREYCVVRRLATNTPLQALVLLNDPTYVEASRRLAERLLKEAPDAVPARVAHAYGLVLGRAPTAAEAKTLARLYNRSLSAFRADPAAAEKLLSVGESPRDKKADPAVLAAWATVAGALLNTDEAITRG